VSALAWAALVIVGGAILWVLWVAIIGSTGDPWDSDW
jgi:hypothetical protein